MQNKTPLKIQNFYKYIIFLLGSIFLLSCDTTYKDVMSDDVSEIAKSESNEINDRQINIDELLVKKETLDLIDLIPVKRIAILLPVTGRYSKVGKAIKEGIEMELQSFPNDVRPKLSIFDTGDSDINIRKIYGELMLGDFDFVIGPLKKELINKLILYSSESLPILTLNYASNLNKFKKKMFQFGLLPEDEAICIAEKSIIDGNNNASLIYPQNSWGKRIAESFSLRYKELGGKIIDEVIYDKDMNKINDSVKSLLKIEESIKRKNKIQNLLNVKLQYKPYIPNDLNTIFAVGTSKDMRLIKPQFNFNFAENIPFYSTSHIYNGVPDRENNKDLNDIKFCDVPWLYNDKDLSKKNMFLENLERRELLRFVALGMDSIKVIHNIERMQQDKNKYLEGNTGYLQLDDFNKIRRDLKIIKFKNGETREIPF
tara:strand:- start:1131 stop:2414 length:1284 start_codon:yes stop_codon:yes gene_type:complete